MKPSALILGAGLALSGCDAESPVIAETSSQEIKEEASNPEVVAIPKNVSAYEADLAVSLSQAEAAYKTAQESFGIQVRDALKEIGKEIKAKNLIGADYVCDRVRLVEEAATKLAQPKAFAYQLQDASISIEFNMNLAAFYLAARKDFGTEGIFAEKEVEEKDLVEITVARPGRKHEFVYSVDTREGCGIETLGIAFASGTDALVPMERLTVEEDCARGETRKSLESYNGGDRLTHEHSQFEPPFPVPTRLSGVWNGYDLEFGN